MKTSVIDVKDMLSVLSVPGVEERIGKVPGVESVTVNHAAGNATVRYDETRLDIADIRSDVRQSGYEDEDTPAATSAGGGHGGHAAPGAPPAIPTSAASKSPSSGPATVGAASAGTAQQDKPTPDAAPSTTPKPSPDASAAKPASTAATGGGQPAKATPDKS